MHNKHTANLNDAETKKHDEESPDCDVHTINCNILAVEDETACKARCCVQTHLTHLSSCQRKCFILFKLTTLQHLIFSPCDALKKFHSIQNTIMQSMMRPHESQYHNHRFQHQNRINGGKESREGFLFKTTGDTWDQIYGWDKNRKTFIVGSWAINLHLLMHSPTNKNVSVEWV